MRKCKRARDRTGNIFYFMKSKFQVISLSILADLPIKVQMNSQQVLVSRLSDIMV
jgi:hypothetical protein